MILNVKNENYGLSVSSHNDWVVVGNPSSFRYSPLTASFKPTGSVDIFKYNTLTNQHDFLFTLYKPDAAGNDILLAEDTGSSEIHTDIYKSRWIPNVVNIQGQYYYRPIQIIDQDRKIGLDADLYLTKFEDDYGNSVDVFNDVLVIGSRWHNQRLDISSKTVYFTGSSVDVYNLSAINYSPLEGLVSTGSSFLVASLTPPATEQISGSFGYSVSTNNEWIAVGSPGFNKNTGSVHLYRREFADNPNNFSWSYHSTITGSTLFTGSMFGYSVDINKATGSYSGSLIVGCGNKRVGGNQAYLFEFTQSSWKQTQIFSSDRTIGYLPFYDTYPILKCPNYNIDGFGNSVALYKDVVVIGAPTDRWIYEYSGSREYKQGCYYVFERCADKSKGWNKVLKSYGNNKTLKNNKLGYSVDVWDDKISVGCPKSNLNTLHPCYLEGSIFQSNYCSSDLESYIQGQWLLLQKNTSSNGWDTVNVFQKKKRALAPYRGFGGSISLGNKSIVVGAPMIISGSHRNFDIDHTGSFNSDVLDNMEDICGKSYIYNLNNLRDEYHVGNVFYRNGKIVLNTSGSDFDGIWFNDINERGYEYELHFNNKQTIYEKQIVCTVNPGEFNVSTNPTAVIRPSSNFDLNNNGKVDWQDMDMILRYMQLLNTRYGTATTDWSSSLLKTDDEVSVYNYYSSINPQFNSQDEFVSQSFYTILNNIPNSELDFNEDSKIDINDLEIFWKYCINRLNQVNYQSYTSAGSKRKLFNEILDYLDEKTLKKSVSVVRNEFLTYNSQSKSDKTGSYLAPYVTTIGIYSGLDLIAVGKLGSPIKLAGEFPTNFVVKMDF